MLSETISYFEKIENLKRFQKFARISEHLKLNKDIIVKYLHYNKLTPFNPKLNRHPEWIAKLYYWCTPDELKDRIVYFPDNIINIKGLNQRDRNFKLYGKDYSEYAYKKSFKNYSKAQKSREGDSRCYWPNNIKFWRNYDNPEQMLKDHLERQNTTLLRGEDWHNAANRKWWTLEYWIEQGVTNPEAALNYAKEEHAKKSVEGFKNSFKIRYGDKWEKEYRKVKLRTGKLLASNPGTRTSKISMIKFNKIFKELQIRACDVKYEWFVRDGSNIYFYDAKVGNLLIEFDGLAWHYYENYHNEYRGHIFGISPEESIRKDRYKDKLAVDKGFTIVRINDKMSIQEMISIIKDAI